MEELQRFLDPDNALKSPDKPIPYLNFMEWSQQSKLSARRSNDLSLAPIDDGPVNLYRQGDKIGNISGYLVSYSFGPTKSNPVPKVRIRACTNYPRKSPREKKWPPDARFFTAVYDSPGDILGFIEIATPRSIFPLAGIVAFLASLFSRNEEP